RDCRRVRRCLERSLVRRVRRVSRVPAVWHRVATCCSASLLSQVVFAGDACVSTHEWSAAPHLPTAPRSAHLDGSLHTAYATRLGLYLPTSHSPRSRHGYSHTLLCRCRSQQLRPQQRQVSASRLE